MPAWQVLTTTAPRNAHAAIPVQVWLMPNGVAETRQGVVAMMHDLHPTAEVVAVSEVRQGGLDE